MPGHDATLTVERQGGASALVAHARVKGFSGLTQLVAALVYARRGWRVFPCGRDKKPLVKDWPNVATTDEVQIRRWWGHDPKASIGGLTGPTMGAWVLDVDLPEGPATLAALEAAHGALPATLEQRTGGGGRQLFFRWPGGRDVPSRAGKIGKKLDTRGRGGYVVVPPSGHPSGGTYAWANELPMADAPAWLLDLVCPTPKPETPRPEPRTSTRHGGASAYGKSALDAETARVAGAAHGERNATVNEAAFALGQLVEGGEVDRAEAESMLLAAAQFCGLPEGEARKTIQSGMAAGRQEPRSAPEKPREAEAREPEVDQPEWPAPIPFDEHIPPPIPPDLIPGVIKDFALAVAESIQVPFELVLCNCLGTLAVAAQRKFRIEVKDGYSEGLNIYALCPLPPGERKSATVEVCKRPLVEWQKQARLEAAEHIQAAESERKTLEKIIEAKRASAARAATSEARREAIAEIQALERELPEVPACPRLLADDFTPEALGALMGRHGERIGLLEAEGGIFDTLAGRYSHNVPNLDAVLKFWSGESCQIDRRGREAIFLSNPHLTLAISPQPDVVRGLADKPGFRGRGLIGRFVFFMPGSRLGYRSGETFPVPTAVADAWKDTVTRILSLPWAVDEHGKDTAHVVRLDPDASFRWKRFDEAVEMELRPGGEFEHMKDWAGKFPGQAVRLAGLFHVAVDPEPHRHPLAGETMRAALSVAVILADHAKAAYSLMGSNPAMECALSIVRWVVRDRVEQFSGRDALRAVRGRFPTMGLVNPGLELLEERAFIRQAEASHTGPGRKPSAVYVTNPLTWR